jgi:uncharacterized protein involved in outer membrane biogenesis
MSNAIKYGLGGFLALAVIIFLVLMFSINSIVKSGIEDIGTEMTGTAVTVDRVLISPFSGKGQISGFRIANPDDYSREYVIEVEDFSIELDIFSLFTNEIAIHEIIISSPSIFVEQKLPGNNINTILRHIREIDTGETTDAEIIIEHFLMTDGVADLYTEIGGERSARVEISSVELHDLGRGGGRQALEDVIKEIAERVGEEALKGAARSGGEQIRDAIRDIFD